ncbi:F-box domain protein [Cryptosporidium felis]|nr:F-box domain protein [Cryptosporidium felis]
MRRRSEFLVNWNSLLNGEEENQSENSESEDGKLSSNNSHENSSRSSSDNEEKSTENKQQNSSEKKLEEPKSNGTKCVPSKREVTVLKVNLLEIFSKLNLKAKKNFLDFVEDKYLLELRLVCKVLNRYCDGYIRHSLKSCYFFNVPLTRLTMDFWFAAMRFFFLEAGRVLPLNRVKYGPIVAALKHNHMILPVSVDQMKSHLVVTLDKLLPEHIVFCNHFHPQPHTCDVNLEIKGQSKVFFDEIDIVKFVRQYFMYLEVMDDELIRGNRQLTRHRLALYLFEFLKSIKMMSEKGNGVFRLSRIEYLVNTGTILRHRIWHQLYASWGSSTNAKKRSNEEPRKSGESSGSREKASNDSKASSSASKPKRLSDSSTQIKKTSKDTPSAPGTHKPSTSNNPDELIVEVFLTIADHFQWDS